MSDLAVPGIHRAIVAILAETPNVAKTKMNDRQGYAFRGIDDLYAACQPLMAKHGVHIVPYRVVEDSICEREGGSKTVVLHVRQRIEFRVYHQDGSFVSCETTGEALDYGGDKASNKAMSAAMKYALIQLFTIPTGEKIDTEEPHANEGAAGRAKPKRERARPGPQQRPPADSGMTPAPPAANEVDVLGKDPNSQVWRVRGHAPRASAAHLEEIGRLRGQLGIEQHAWSRALFDAYGKTDHVDLSDGEASAWVAKLQVSLSRRQKATEAHSATP